MRYKIENDTRFVKDASNKAVLNVDKDGLTAYKIQRENIKKSLSLQNEVQQLKEDVSEIKNMLSQLININNKNQD